MNQKQTQKKYLNLLKSRFECKALTSGARLDIEVKLSNNFQGFNIGIVAVLWNSENKDHEVMYLPHGLQTFDGYEIHSKWVKVNTKNVIQTILDDINY